MPKKKKANLKAKKKKDQPRVLRGMTIKGNINKSGRKKRPAKKMIKLYSSPRSK